MTTKQPCNNQVAILQAAITDATCQQCVASTKNCLLQRVSTLLSSGSTVATVANQTSTLQPGRTVATCQHLLSLGNPMLQPRSTVATSHNCCNQVALCCTHQHCCNQAALWWKQSALLQARLHFFATKKHSYSRAAVLQPVSTVATRQHCLANQTALHCNQTALLQPNSICRLILVKSARAASWQK